MDDVDEVGLASQEAGRAAALADILGSSAPKKLIVAGPGTGKSFTFKKVLETAPGGPKLALTFINALAADLGENLGSLAETYTFHGYCRRMLHTTPTAGISMGVDYYPQLLQIQAADQTVLSGAAVDGRAIEHDFHYLDHSTGLLDAAVRSGDYYNAVGHIDSVYRMLRHFEANGDAVPRYSQVVVDEYQDFSLLEVRFIAALTTDSPMLIVGDDDQALYGFKHASADYIRDLDGDDTWSRFELPYCSRCTAVMVAATHTCIARAQAAGLLIGRLPKRYECYLPEKEAESRAYPKIIHAHCSVERNNAPYLARYIHQRIIDILPDEVRESHSRGYPTVLIVGPMQFVTRVHEYLKGYFKQIELKRSSQSDTQILDGYRRIVADPNSRLGWRIVLHCDPIPELRGAVTAALLNCDELVELLPRRYVDRHRRIVELVSRLLAGESLSAQESADVEAATRIRYLDLVTLLTGATEEQSPESRNKDEPTIVLTSLVGAKGLQAGHTFVLGLNEHHFPRSNAAPTDDEVCSLLVALTRGKKSCTLLSCGRFGNQALNNSVFLNWLTPHLTHETVDAQWFRSHST